VNGEYESLWKEVIVARLRYYSNIYFEWLWKNIKDPRQVRLSTVFRTQYLPNVEHVYVKR
jgi:hypothetical protein